MARVILPTELKRAVLALQEGHVVGMPTETVYGLAAAIDSEDALKTIFKIKERPFFDPLIVHISALSQLGQVVSEWPKLAQRLADSFWPGPLTMVLPKHNNINPLITSGLLTVGVRFSNHPLAQQLINEVGCPLAAPSANKFGRTSPTMASHVVSEFENEDVFVLDGGPCEVGLESTVIGVKESSITIFRPGMITIENIQEAISGLPDITIGVQESVASPGHLKHHYMPKHPLVILNSKDQIEKHQVDIERHIKKPIYKATELKLSDSPVEAARELYTLLRQCDKDNPDIIWVKKSHHHQSSNWAAIWDRLTKAASLDYSS